MKIMNLTLTVYQMNLTMKNYESDFDCISNESDYEDDFESEYDFYE